METFLCRLKRSASPSVKGTQASAPVSPKQVYNCGKASVCACVVQFYQGLQLNLQGTGFKAPHQHGWWGHGLQMHLQSCFQGLVGRILYKPMWLQDVLTAKKLSPLKVQWQSNKINTRLPPEGQTARCSTPNWRPPQGWNFPTPLHVPQRTAVLPRAPACKELHTERPPEKVARLTDSIPMLHPGTWKVKKMSVKCKIFPGWHGGAYMTLRLITPADCPNITPNLDTISVETTCKGIPVS